MEIGMLMLAQLAESIERYRPRRNNQTDVSEQVEELLRVARARARKTGQSLGQVLRDHRDALEEGGEKSKFVLTTTNSRSEHASNAKVHAAMELQDQRRAQHQPSAFLAATARVVDRRTEHLVPYVEREELRPPAHVATSTSVARLPAPRHHAGGQNPNAEQLRLMAPPDALVNQSKRPMALKHNPEGGGGMHNPISTDNAAPRPGGNFGKVRKVTKDGKVIYDLTQGG
tara:strand:+ start:523 stop:1209 length:687 start_codon:yes stop_codon:yes gene_type:complete